MYRRGGPTPGVGPAGGFPPPRGGVFSHPRFHPVGPPHIGGAPHVIVSRPESRSVVDFYEIVVLVALIVVDVVLVFILIGILKDIEG